MVFWPYHGVIQRLTEKSVYRTSVPVRTLGRQFRRSMHLFVVDAGCDNMLNFNIAALTAPQYNTHRFGIYFADTPRHADILILLGPPLSALHDAVAATLAQAPKPFGVLLVGGAPEMAPQQEPVESTSGTPQPGSFRELIDPALVVGFLPGSPGPSDIFAALLAIQRGDDSRAISKSRGALI